MKRKASSSPNKKRTKKESATDVATTSFQLTDLVEELLVKAFSYLSFKDRQVNRRVCKHLLQFVDKSTPGAKGLHVESKSNPELDTRERSTVRMKANEHVRDVVNLVIEFERTYRSARLQRAQLAALLQSRVPPLRSIRPTWLRFLLKSDTGHGEAFAMLMQHMVSQQVARSVSRIILWQECPLESLSEVQQACSLFDRSSESGVQSLRLISGCPRMLLPVATFFPRLVSLAFQFRRVIEERTEAETFVRELATLSVHRSLRELRIECADKLFRSAMIEIELQLMTSLASFSNLHKLYSHINCRRSRFNTEGEYERFVIAFGNMLRGMSSLQSLGKLKTPGSEFWGKIQEHNIMFNGIRELQFDFQARTLDRVEAMVQGLLTCAPSLTTLSLRATFRRSSAEDERAVQALSGLRLHPTLKELKLFPDSMWQGLHSRLQQELGTNIKVCLLRTFMA